MTTFYLPLIFILVLYWRIYQAARKRINKRKTDTSSVKRLKKSETPKKFSAAKFRFKNRHKLPTNDEWDSSQNSEAVSSLVIERAISSSILVDIEHSQKASMRSSTKSDNFNNNSDNMNNNSIEVDENRSSDDVIDIASSENINKLQQVNCESELTQRVEHASADDEKLAKVNVYEQVRSSTVVD